MKPMKMREKVQTKLNNMASILLDDIILPEQEEQSGAESIQASYYDKFGNKFTFTLSLNVTPKQKVEPSEPTPTVDEQLSAILLEISRIEADIEDLKTYHNQPSTETPNEEDTQGSDSNGEND